MRVVLAVLLGAGVASLALLPEPGSLLIAFIALLLGFLLAGAKAAVDLIELTPSELVGGRRRAGRARARAHARHDRRTPCSSARCSPSPSWLRDCRVAVTMAR